MIESVSALVGILAAAMALAGFVGALIARGRASADETTLAVWKGEAEAQKARGDRLESALKDLTDRVVRVEHENATLRELVTGRQEMVTLRQDMNTGFAELRAILVPVTIGGAK